MRVTLDRNPLPAGEPTWVTTRVTNVGKDDVVWFHDGCAIAVGVHGAMDERRWRLGHGHPAVGAQFKKFALEHQRIEDGAINIAFYSEDLLQIGRFGCADLGISDMIAPGKMIEQRAVWDGAAWLQLGLPPSGPLTLRVSAGYYWRARDGEPANIRSALLEFDMQAWILTGRGDALLDPPEVVDAALASQEFVTWLKSRRLRYGHDPVLRFDPSTGLWEVGLLDYETERLHVALVHPATGEVVSIVDRAWDSDVDGFP